MKDQLKRGKGLDPDRHTIGRGREGVLPPKRTKAKKSVPSFAKEEKDRLFTWSSERLNSNNRMAK